MLFLCPHFKRVLKKRDALKSHENQSLGEETSLKDGKKTVCLAFRGELSCSVQTYL